MFLLTGCFDDFKNREIAADSMILFMLLTTASNGNSQSRRCCRF